MKNKNILIGIWFLIIIAIIIVSLQSKFTPPANYQLDKILHFISYMSISIMPMILFKYRSRITFAQLLILIVAITTEIMQTYVPGRTGSYGDVLANIAGILCGILIGRAIAKFINR